MTDTADVLEQPPEVDAPPARRARILDRPGPSILDEFRAMPLEDQEAWIDRAPVEQVALVMAEDWSLAARPAQQWPDGDWFGWFTLAGRGGGKTRTGAENTWERIKELEPHVEHNADGAVRWGLVAPTFKDIRDTMIGGESGLHRVLPPSALINGSWEDSYNKSEQIIELEAGHKLFGYSSEKPGNLRGPQHHGMWMDEPATFKDAHLGYSQEEDTTFDMALLGLRLPPDPRLIVTGTPKNNALIKAILADPEFVVTKWSSYDNAHNLAVQARRRIFGRYEGTRLGQQELHAEVLEGVGTMFQRGWWNFIDSLTELPNAGRGWRWARYWDLAATEHNGDNDPDYTAGALIGVQPRDRTYCIGHIVRFREAPGKRDDTIKQRAREDGLRRMYVEQEKAQAGKSVVSALSRHLDDVNVRVIGDPVSGGRPVDEATGREGKASEAKIMRAEPVAGAAQQGRVYVVRGSWTADWLDESEEFPNGAHFDQVDAVSGGFKVLGEKHEGKSGTATTLGAMSLEEVMDARDVAMAQKATPSRNARSRKRRTGSAASITLAR